MKVRLSQKDIQLLSFLRKYKLMCATESEKIFKSKGYYKKRLKVLENEKYIRRIDRYHIKLDKNGIKLIKEIGYDYHNLCRRIDYRDRVKEISKIACLTLDSDISFIASWDLKDKEIFTETGRKYIGELNYQNQKYLAYYISKDKGTVYIKQIINDIKKAINYKNIIVFVENLKPISKSNQYFIFGNESTVIINANKENLERMRLFQNIDLYEIIKKIYKEKEVLLSNWKKADYMTEDRIYILLMPFLDTEKLHRLNIFYKDNKKTNKKIDILTLKENKEKIDEILTYKTNIITIDSLIGGIDGELEEV